MNILYISDDGHQFNTEEGCLLHEKLIQLNKLKVKMYTFDLKPTNNFYEAYIICIDDEESAKIFNDLYMINFSQKLHTGTYFYSNINEDQSFYTAEEYKAELFKQNETIELIQNFLKNKNE